MRRGEPLPPVWLAPGAVADAAVLLRLGPLDTVPVPIGPVAVRRPGDDPAPRIHQVGVGGLDHGCAPGWSVPEAEERLRWCAARGLQGVLAVRGTTTGELAEVVTRVRRSLDADALAAVEVDLRGADDQACLKTMARVREAAPRDLLLLARLSALQPDLVAAARGCVAGGAGAVVVCGSVPLAEDRWWSGPSTAAVCRAGVRALRLADEERRWPSVPLVAAGGVHDLATARQALTEGATAVQLGTALWADPTVLRTLVECLP